MFELPGEGVWTLLLGQDDFRAGRGLGFGKYCVAALCKVAELAGKGDRGEGIGVHSQSPGQKSWRPGWGVGGGHGTRERTQA